MATTGTREVDIEVHSVDDWEAIYVDGRLYYQNSGSGLRIEEFILKHFKVSPGVGLTIKSYRDEYHEYETEVQIHVMNKGRFPEMLSDIHALENPFID